MRRRWWIGRRVVVLLVVSCWIVAPAGAEYDPFKVSKERFRQDVKRIVVRPIRVPADLDGGERIVKRVMHAVGSRLEQMGYEVVEDASFDALWRRFAEEVGGVYDTTTGVADEKKFELVREYTLRELASEHDVDAYVHLNFFSRVAQPRYRRVLNSSLTALGDDLTWKDQGMPFAEGLPVWPQLVVGQWLGMSIYDVRGVVLYGVSYPIAWSRIYAARSFEDRPSAEVYTGDDLDEATRMIVRHLDFERTTDPEE
ncbi:MAG: hypothetical protein NXI30_00115 [bacterium]|nr:hypothetical protein [bacterium]